MRELLKSPEFRNVVTYFKSMDFKDKNVYGNWLAQTYYFVCHSVRLSALGTATLKADDPMSRRMLTHTIEEKGHHTIAMKDLEALGKKIEDFPAFGLTNAFYQAQYYKVLFEHPVHLLGQIIMLEAVSVEVGPWMYDVVKKAHGDKACRFVHVHANEDQDHVEKAFDALTAAAVSHRKGVEENFFQACELYYGILKSVQEQSFRKISQAA